MGTVCSVAFQKAQCCPRGAPRNAPLLHPARNTWDSVLHEIPCVGGGVLFLKYEVPCKSSWSPLEILVVCYRCFIVYFQTAVFPFFGVFFFSFSIKSFQKSLTSHPWQSASQSPQVPSREIPPPAPVTVSRQLGGLLFEELGVHVYQHWRRHHPEHEPPLRAGSRDSANSGGL